MFFAVLTGNDEWTEIVDFVHAERKTLKKYLELPNGIPSHDTIQKVFCILRPEKLQRILVNILVQFVTAAVRDRDEYLYRNDSLDCCIGDIIAADGKEIRGTTGKKHADGQNGHILNEFNVMSTEWGICLSSTGTDEKAMKFLKCRR